MRGTEEDEAWEVASSDGGGSTSESDGEAQSCPAAAQKRAPAAGPAVPRLQMAPAPTRTYVSSARAPVPAAPVQAASQAPSTGNTASIMTLVSHLRSDNFRLRQALVNAQREVEEASQKAESGEAPDFAHLLALAKELGDGLGGIGAGEDWWGSSEEPELAVPATARVFAMDDSPRGESKEAPAEPPDAEKAQLRQRVACLEGELKASRSEVELLKARLALRDSQLASLQN